MIWLTADLHLDHGNVIHFCKRPWLKLDGHSDKDAMNEALIRNWNERVQPDDFILNLGDHAFGPRNRVAELTRRLNGNKFLVRGNHDRFSRACYRQMGFYDVKNSMTMGRIWLQHRPPVDAQAQDLVKQGFGVVLCGHKHNHWAEKTMTCGLRVINVGVDVRNYQPVSLAELGVEHLSLPKLAQALHRHIPFGDCLCPQGKDHY